MTALRFMSHSRFASGFALALIAVLVAGCSSGGSSRAPVDYGAQRSAARPSTYTVQEGDTVYAVSRRFGVPVRALIDANGLVSPFHLKAGQTLALGTQTDYVVTRGDTLTGIARKTGVSFTTLARLNGLEPPYPLQAGQKLILPGAESGNVQVASRDSSGESSVILSPQLAKTQNAAQPAASGASQAGTGDSYRPVEVRGGTPSAPTATSAAPVSAAPASAPNSAPTASPAVVTAQAPAAAIEPSGAAAQTAMAQPAAVTSPVVVPPPPPRSGQGYVWPVKGRVIAEFGATGKGQHNDGINIEVAKGTPVLAAEDGVVAYSGNELRGFGNLLLLKHADGWMTAYAHNEKLLVKRGDMVKRGQQMALSGDSGGVSPPQLHFEMRKGTRAIDPLTVLGKSVSPTASLGGQPNPG